MSVWFRWYVSTSLTFLTNLRFKYCIIFNLTNPPFCDKATKSRASSKTARCPFDSCFYILNGNLNPASEDYRAAFLINADVIDQTTPQFFPELRLFSRQIFQLVDEVRENFPRVILLLDECLQFLKSAPGILSYPYSVYASTSI